MLERTRLPGAPALHSSTRAPVEPPLSLRCCAETGMHASSGGPSTRRDVPKRLSRAAEAGIRLWPAADVDAQPNHSLCSCARLLRDVRETGSRVSQALDSGQQRNLEAGRADGVALLEEHKRMCARAGPGHSSCLASTSCAGSESTCAPSCASSREVQQTA